MPWPQGSLPGEAQVTHLNSPHLPLAILARLFKCGTDQLQRMSPGGADIPQNRGRPGAPQGDFTTFHPDWFVDGVFTRREMQHSASFTEGLHRRLDADMIPDVHFLRTPFLRRPRLQAGSGLYQAQ